MRKPHIVLQLLLCVLFVSANVEKVIFLGPGGVAECSNHLDVYTLQHDVLTPLKPAIRRELTATFPSYTNSWRGSDSWIVLDELESQRRYEVRICWSATQPTAFKVSIYDPELVFTSPALNSSFYQTAETYRNKDNPTQEFLTAQRTASGDQCRQAHSLILRISAAADYFTTDDSLMNDVPAVKVDIILDPYFLNTVPWSLLPTAVYISVLAVASVYLSKYIWQGLSFLVESDGRGSASHESNPRLKED